VFPINAKEGGDDFLMNALMECNILRYSWANISASRAMGELNDTYQPLIKNISADTGLKI